jgi:hypothetical protein
MIVPAMQTLFGNPYLASRLAIFSFRLLVARPSLLDRSHQEYQIGLCRAFGSTVQ